MGRVINIALTTLVLTLVLAGSSEAAKRNKQSFDKLAGEILETMQSFYPVLATEKGIHSYDRRLTDYSSNAVKEMISQLDKYVKELHKYRKFDFETADSINFLLTLLCFKENTHTFSRDL